MKHAIFQATRVIFCFGTPHRGLLINDIISIVNHETHTEQASLVESIGKNSNELKLELEKFLGIVHNFKVFSFYKQFKTKG
jgi:hypothetical protein